MAARRDHERHHQRDRGPLPFPLDTPFGIKQAYLNIRGYAEFDHQNRAQGFDTWLSLTISNPTPAPPTPPLIHK